MNLKNKQLIYSLCIIIVFFVTMAGFYRYGKDFNRNGTVKTSSTDFDIVTCPEFRHDMIATNNETTNIIYPSKYTKVSIIPDEHSAVAGDSVTGEIYLMNNYGQVERPCIDIGLRFFTNIESSKVDIILENSSEKDNISVTVTNKIVMRELENIPIQIINLIKPFTDEWWYPHFINEVDINGDNQNDYLISLLDQFTNFRNYAILHNKQPNKLLIIESEPGGAYSITGFSDNVIMCGACGGMMGNPFVDIGYNSEQKTIKIKHYGGTSWRWNNEIEIKKIDDIWMVIKSYNFASNLNDFENEKSISENTYKIPISKWSEEYNKNVFLTVKKYISPGEFDDSLPKSPREIALDNYKNFPEEFKTTNYNGIVYTLVPYKESMDKYIFKNFPEEFNGTKQGSEKTNRSGFFILKNNEILWESSRIFSSLDFNATYFNDLDNDGIQEIVATDQGKRPNLPHYCKVTIYKWNNSNFLEILTNLDLREPDYGCYDIDDSHIKDVDGDKIKEVLSETIKDNIKTNRTYKWNGTEYFLWKEQKEPFGPNLRNQ